MGLNGVMSNLHSRTRNINRSEPVEVGECAPPDVPPRSAKTLSMGFESDGPLIVDPVLPSIFSNRPCRTGLSHSVSGDTVSLTAALYQLMFSSICYALAVPELDRAYFLRFGTFCRKACGGKALTIGLVRLRVERAAQRLPRM